ncbi:hypothetical protein BDN70DRAFT_702819 [Pholiota conissans]|uniref:Uncharacterized protein n=1 Tax=Pholiota conissans TaxID=109636 RepID=A0A9P5Z0X3_9AGAR|nr:hypothetical protein BDN70DRAFT_702819 [Pholiota conissans]
MVVGFEFRGMPIDVAYSVAIFVETLIHGIYTSLFIAAMSVLLKRSKGKRAPNNSRNWLFPVATILMYIISSFHTVLGFYRFMRAYVLPGAIGWTFFWEFKNWDTFTTNLLVCLITWIGDILVIYRCYCVWNNNLILIIIPLILLAASVAVNVYVLVWFGNPLAYSPHSEIMALNSIYPISLAQNVITTGLITLKIWNQHRNSSASGVVDRSSRLSLLKIVRIIIESAMIYTGQLFILLVLYFRNDTFQYIVQCAIVPSLGIVFVLIALRVHNARQRDVAMGTSVGFIPSAWLRDSDSGIELSQQDSGSVDVEFRVSEVKSDGHQAADPEQAAFASPYPSYKARSIVRQSADVQ